MPSTTNMEYRVLVVQWGIEVIDEPSGDSKVEFFLTMFRASSLSVMTRNCLGISLKVKGLYMN